MRLLFGRLADQQWPYNPKQRQQHRHKWKWKREKLARMQYLLSQLNVINVIFIFIDMSMESFFNSILIFISHSSIPLIFFLAHTQFLPRAHTHTFHVIDISSHPFGWFVHSIIHSLIFFKNSPALVQAPPELFGYHWPYSLIKFIIGPMTFFLLLLFTIAIAVILFCFVCLKINMALWLAILVSFVFFICFVIENFPCSFFSSDKFAAGDAVAIALAHILQAD